MSIHLVECAATTKVAGPDGREHPLEPSWKLVLMAFADSADTTTGIGLPGLDQTMAWSGLSRSRTFEVTNELERLGLLRKHRGGRNGRRAEYVVFPLGCCPQHPKPTDEDSSDIGSGPSDPMSGAKSDPSDPSVDTAQGPTDRTLSVRPVGPLGSDQGPTHRTPSLTTTTSPNPATASQGTCPAHPNGPAANCRSCGTSPRSLARQAERDAAEQRRRDSEAAIQADRRRKAETADVDAAARAAEARRLMREKAVSRG